MNSKLAKRLRRNVRAVLGIDSIPAARRYSTSHPRYVKAYDPELDEVVDELYSCTYRVHAEEPRAVYKHYKRIVKREVLLEKLQ